MPVPHDEPTLPNSRRARIRLRLARGLRRRQPRTASGRPVVSSVQLDVFWKGEVNTVVIMRHPYSK
jgi:hypothetical protein